MRFHIVMAKTIGDLMTLRRTLAVVGFGLLPPVVLAATWWRTLFQNGTMSFEMQTGYLVGAFMVMAFLWQAGFYLAYSGIAFPGLEMVAKEESQGTLLMMVSKPISRVQFLLGKFLALVLTALVLELVLLLGTLVAFWAIIGIDPYTLNVLLGLVPWIFLFSIIVSILFAAISIALSALVKNNAMRSVVMLLVLGLVFAAGPMMRAMWSDKYESYHLYYVDGSYNLGNAYVMFLDKAEQGRMLPQAQAWLGLSTGAYRAGPQTLLVMFLGGPAGFDPDIGAMSPSLERTTYLAPAVSVILCLLAGLIAFGVGAVAMNRKEVQ